MKNQTMKNVALIAAFTGATLVDLAVRGKIAKKIKEEKKETEEFKQEYKEAKEEIAQSRVELESRRVKSGLAADEEPTAEAMERYYELGYDTGRCVAQEINYKLIEAANPKLQKAQKDGYEAGYAAEKKFLKNEFDKSCSESEENMNELYNKFLKDCPSATEYEKTQYKEFLKESHETCVERLKQIWHQQ